MRVTAILSSMLVIIIFSPVAVQSEESNSCCESTDFNLFLIGEADSGQLTPFGSDLDEEYEVEVTSSVLGEVEIGSWMVEWGEDGSYSSGTWTFIIPYEIIDSAGVSANATVVLKIGGNTYESSSQIPALYLTGSGELQVPVEVEAGEISKNDKIEVDFSIRSVIFSNPGSESGIRFQWGSTEMDASLSISFPLVHVEIREANVRGDLVFFPVRLTSGFGDSMWTASTGFLKVNNEDISESPIVNSNDEWVDVTFVWRPSDSVAGTVRTDFQLTPQDSLSIDVDKIHDVTLGENTGDNSWYPDEEPPRDGGSRLQVTINCEYDGNSIDSDTIIRFDGAMSQWTRWGLDNIGNKSLGSNSWWRNLNTYTNSVSSSEKQNGQVDDSELSALENHLRGSKSDLKSFLSIGLMIDPESVFGVDPVDFGPMTISVDLGKSRAFNSELISITITSEYDVQEDSRQTLIEDFVRPGGYDFWDEVSFSFEIRTGVLSGFSGVNLDNEEIDYNHRRWIITEVLSLEDSDIQSDEDFRLEFMASNALLFSPLISATISVFALSIALGIGMALTRRRTRVPSMIVISVLGILSLAIYWLGLPMPIVLGVVGSSILLVFPAAIISPTKSSEDRVNTGMALGRVKCPSCGKKNTVESDVRPLRIDCYGCGSTLRIE
ncbi:MAG: hypothetical protein CMA12_01490 [Euryarchaeota archaeon]|nr:hypothetical protein [Euryarchaeota archaeon]OUW22913.1 MAG: hypothetical protein CBD33_00065 [Euryarchaeota archaeon TMED173]